MALHQKLFFLLLVLLPTQLGFHFWPEWAMVLGRRVDYLSPIIFLTDILIVFTLISWFIEKHKKFFPRSGIWLRQTFFKLTPILLFIALNTFFAASIPVAIYKWLKVLEFVGFGLYIVKTKPTLSAITYPLSLGVLYSSLIAIAQFFFQHSLGGIFWWLGERTFSVDTPGIARMSWCLIPGSWCREFVRPYATFPHPNVLGGYLAAMLPLLIFNFQFSIFNQTKKFTIFKLITIALAMIALILTFSRSAWMVGVLGMSVIFYELRGKQKIFLPLIFAAVFLVLLTTVSFKINDESLVIRQQLNNVAMKQWQTSPLVGVGLGNFLVRLPEILPSRQIYFLQPVHNIYLLILAETGVIGLTIFVWVILHAFKNFKFQISNLKFALLALLLLGLVDHYPITLQQGQLLLVILLALSNFR